MKKNIFNPGVTEEIIDRIMSLRPTDSAKWGVMTATEMLKHCRLANSQILEGELPMQAPTFKQKMIGFLCLNILPAFPKNVKGAASIETHGRVAVHQFEDERVRYVQILQRLCEMNVPITGIHPAFGKLSKTGWGKSIWMHMDHHLRQFGA